MIQNRRAVKPGRKVLEIPDTTHCNSCRKNTATLACNCHKTMTFLCDKCVPTHIRENKWEFHLFIHVDSVDPKAAPPSTPCVQPGSVDSLLKLNFELNISKIDIFNIRDKIYFIFHIFEELLLCKHRKST